MSDVERARQLLSDPTLYPDAPGTWTPPTITETVPVPRSLIEAAEDVMKNADVWNTDAQAIEVTAWTLHRLKEQIDAWKAGQG
jgi:hypothetical protein